MTNTNKIICEFDRCQAMATLFVYSRDIDSTTVDIFLCHKHWKKGKRFFELLDPAITADFRSKGFSTKGTPARFVNEEPS